MRCISLPTLLLTVLVMFTAGCGSDFLDINDNPNVATRPPLDGLMASASLNTALNQASVSSSFAGFYVQYFASPNAGSTTDIYQPIETGGTWFDIYNTMTDLYDLIRFGQEDGLARHVAIAKVLMVMNLGLVVDNWGAAPYDDAFSGETLRPEYDTAEELYATIFRLLDEAGTGLAAAVDAPPVGEGSDFVFNGDLNKWALAVASLRARYLNHLSGTDRYDPAAVLLAIGEGFKSSEDDADVRTFAVRNPWAQVALNNSNLLLDGWLSVQFVDALNGTTFAVADPRLPLITTPNDSGLFVGTVNGEGRRSGGTDGGIATLVTTGATTKNDSPLDIISFTELKFIEAEASLASGDQERTNEAFRRGVLASMTEIGVDSTTANSYLMKTYGSNPISQDDIFREKYVALFLSPETYVDARRYNFAYKGFKLATSASLNQVPARVPYPSSETDRNGINVPDVTQTDPIFWDK